MEVKINKEIRDFSEAVFFGMSLRQCIFAVLACGMAVLLYFLLSPYLGLEALSWVCIVGAAPFAAVGFIKWHGMTAEQFVWAWIKSELLTPKRLLTNSSTLYYDAVSSPMKQKGKKRKQEDHLKVTALQEKTRRESQPEQVPVSASVQVQIPAPRQIPPPAPEQRLVATPIPTPVQVPSPALTLEIPQVKPAKPLRRRPKHARNPEQFDYMEVTPEYDENTP